MTAYDIRPLGETLGTEALGVDLSKPLDAETLAGAQYCLVVELHVEHAGPEGAERRGVEQAVVYAKAGYFLNTTTQALSVIERVGHPNLKLQLDLYHVQIMEGDLAHRIRALAGRYEHVQIAGNPGRHEPDVGEINYPFLFDLFDEIGYSGWIGCEYRPKGETKAGLGWAKRYGIGA